MLLEEHNSSSYRIKTTLIKLIAEALVFDRFTIQTMAFRRTLIKFAREDVHPALKKVCGALLVEKVLNTEPLTWGRPARSRPNTHESNRFMTHTNPYLPLFTCT